MAAASDLWPGPTRCRVVGTPPCPTRRCARPHRTRHPARRRRAGSAAPIEETAPELAAGRGSCCCSRWLGAAVAAGVLAWQGSQPELVAVPDVTGMARAEAVDRAGRRRVRADFSDVREPGTEQGEVVATQPAAGAELEVWSASLTLFVSLGEPLVSVPDCRRADAFTDANDRLEEQGLVVGSTREEHDEVVAAGLGDRGGDAERGRRTRARCTVVDLVISSGAGEPHRPRDSRRRASVEEAVAVLLTELRLVPCRDRRPVLRHGSGRCR